MDRIILHGNICDKLHETYIKKNADYGDAFTKQYNEYGDIVPLIRIEEKFLRYKTLLTQNRIVVEDETVEDTLFDLANYCILAAIELMQQKKGDK